MSKLNLKDDPFIDEQDEIEWVNGKLDSMLYYMTKEPKDNLLWLKFQLRLIYRGLVTFV